MACRMPIIRMSIGLTLLMATSVIVCAHAESLRCGNRLVLLGDSRMEVRKKCGEPGDVVHSTLIRRASNGNRNRAADREEEAIVVPVEVWTYNFGAHRFMTRLRFVGGIVEGVQTMGYGYDEGGIE
jgi:Protein of unknown function (DUF2845)